MPARLILNADDFGLTPGVNRAIAELHDAGAITSATLMATGTAFEDAVRISRERPMLGVGCHIVLTDGVPMREPVTIPTLCPNGRSFRPKLTDFIRDLLFHRVDPDDIARECEAQILKLQHAGLRVTHLDTHKHTHIFPVVARALASVAQIIGVKALRNPFEPPHAKSHGSPKRRLEIAALSLFQPSYSRAATDVITTDGTFGISATGNLTSATLAGMLAATPSEGTYELLCHPGYNDADLEAVTTRLRLHRQTEYRALLEQIPKLRLQPNPPHLIHYGEL